MLLLYAYCVGTVSSRKIERACYEDLAFRVLTGNQQPDHSRISEFRRRNLDALKGLFVQILRLCQKAGMVSLGHVALDGTKVKANASKHKAMSHERMLRVEKELEKEINALMRRAEILDAQGNPKGTAFDQPLLRRTRRMVLPLDPGTLALAGFELERGLKQIGELPQGAIELSHHLGRLKTLQPLVPHDATHEHSVLLLHPGLVIALIGP
jgi:hypothetical protein